MDITWKLTGRPAGGGQCEQCGRALAHRFEVTSSDDQQKIVGRGCLKAVTGWTLTAAQAARELRMIEVRARRAAAWNAWAAAHPREAATILADCAAYVAAGHMARSGGGASHEMRLYAEEGRLARAPWLMDDYMARRQGFSWAARSNQIELKAS